jgi:hypothetical protein
MIFAAMRAARATNLGPILHLRAYPEHLTVTSGGFAAIGVPKS